MSAGPLVLMGVIAGAHGIRGEVRLKSFAACPEDIAAYGALVDEHGKRWFTIISLKPTKSALIARIAEIGDRDAAQALRGTKLFVPRARLPQPDEDDFYYTDLIGLTVIDAAGTTYGHVLAVDNFGAGDLLHIGEPGRSDLLAFTKATVPEIDLAAGRLVIAPPAGFMTSEHEP